ncbi:MAG TPA: DinB family protein, partial [Flavisolibacter sp.]|nr:DinB family protein [Flavisolibacter sp.]
EKLWAQTSDVKNLPVNISITLLFALHQRWYEFLTSLKEEDWNKTIFHPEHQKEITLWYLLGMYAWHGRHHAAHINNLRSRMNW